VIFETEILSRETPSPRSDSSLVQESDLDLGVRGAPQEEIMTEPGVVRGGGGGTTATLGHKLVPVVEAAPQN
jgi:hypothetical protein